MSRRTTTHWLRLGALFAVIATSSLAAIRIATDLYGIATASQDKVTFEQVFQVAQVVVLILGLSSVVLLWNQSRENAQWNRHWSYHRFFSDCPAALHRRRMMKLMEKYGEDRKLRGLGDALTDEAADAIASSSQERQCLAEYLDGFEQLCGAVNAGVVDEDYAYLIEGARITRASVVFAPFIKILQDVNPKSYEQFVVLAEHFRDRRVKESEKREREEKARLEEQEKQDKKAKEKRRQDLREPRVG